MPYHSTAFYEFVVIPLFMLMGMFAFNSGISERLYYTSYKLVGNFRGGLSAASIFGCALFASICGSSMPTAATMAVIALPEMKKYGYDDALATGSLAAGGTLGVLIPPSIGLVVYGIITEESIGKLLIAGIIPGILMAALFMLTVYVQCKFNPKLGPPGPKVTTMEKVKSLGGIWETALIFLVCIGGIYWGLFTPVEASGVGCLGIFLIGIMKRTLKWEGIIISIKETAKFTSMIFLIIVGAYIFGYFISVGKLPLQISTYFVESGLSRYTILMGVLFMYLLIGCAMDFFSMMILTLPIIYPLITKLGFDSVWFGVIMVIMLEMGQISPPVGINVFTIKGVAKDVPIKTIFWGILPFWGAMIVCLALLIIFPDIVLFLPKSMFAK